jgi:prophage maintenance system killer protein
VLFLDLNGATWVPDPPDVDEAETAMLAVAAREVDEAWFADWLRARVGVHSGDRD